MDVKGKTFGLGTRLVHAGRDPKRADGAVNPPIHRASTLLLDDTDDLFSGKVKTYALEGMAIQEAPCEALVAIEGGAGAVLAPSGLAACTLALLSVTRAGGEILMTDSVYGPTRRFCDTVLKRLGVKTIYYKPRIGAEIAGLINDQTCAVFMESPGSLTFEIQDVPAIARAAQARGVPTMIDNTWSAGVYFDPFKHGVDLSIQALTKYQAGHADAFMGAVLCRTADWRKQIKATYKELGLGASPDDAYLVLRGIRSMQARLERQSASALEVARWLETQAPIARLLHPALSSHPDHVLWRRDFTGASALFALILRPTTPDKLKAFLEGLELFGMGFSWGGYESLIAPYDGQIPRTAEPWNAEGHLVRLSIGLENPADLIDDLANGLARLA
jgi:cystathionine beta-lyase